MFRPFKYPDILLLTDAEDSLEKDGLRLDQPKGYSISICLAWITCPSSMFLLEPEPGIFAYQRV